MVRFDAIRLSYSSHVLIVGITRHYYAFPMFLCLAETHLGTDDTSFQTKHHTLLLFIICIAVR